MELRRLALRQSSEGEELIVLKSDDKQLDIRLQIQIIACPHVITAPVLQDSDGRTMAVLRIDAADDAYLARVEHHAASDRKNRDVAAEGIDQPMFKQMAA